MLPADGATLEDELISADDDDVSLDDEEATRGTLDAEADSFAGGALEPQSDTCIVIVR